MRTGQHRATGEAAEAGGSGAEPARLRRTDVIADRKPPHVVDDRLPARAIGAGIARAAHHVGGLVAGPQASQQRFELRALGRIDHVVGVEPEGIIAGRM